MLEKNLGLYDYEALDKVLTKVGENLWLCILFIVVYKEQVYVFLCF